MVTAPPGAVRTNGRGSAAVVAVAVAVVAVAVAVVAVAVAVVAVGGKPPLMGISTESDVPSPKSSCDVSAESDRDRQSECVSMGYIDSFAALCIDSLAALWTHSPCLVGAPEWRRGGSGLWGGRLHSCWRWH
jgi:hypothetical protein